MSTPYYEDDLVTLYHGDCREVTAWVSAAVMVTDPPYGMDRDLTRTALRSVHGPMKSDGDTAARDAALVEWGSIKPAAVFGHWRRTRPHGVRHLLIWDKVHMALGAASAPYAVTHEEVYILGNGWTPGRRPTVLRFPNLLGDRRPDHPTPKPVGLMEAIISAAPRGVVADPFAGSGSTLVAAKQLGRRAIGIEIDESYCEIAARRLAQDTLFGEVTA